MRKPLRDKPFVVLDTETTGLDPAVHEIIEICIHKPSTGATYTTKIKPQNLECASPKALEINGYNEQDWKDAITFDEAIFEIGDWLHGNVVVGHNVQFDLNMLKGNLKRSQYKDQVRIPYHCVDTVTLAQEHLVPMGLESVSLSAVREFLGLSAKGAHRAQKDVIDTTIVFEKLFRMRKRDKVVLRCKNFIRTLYIM